MTEVLSIDFEPDANSVAIGLEKWSKLISDWRPIWRDAIKLFYRHELRNFETEGASTGDQWAALNKDYAEWKDENAPAPGLPILVFTGTLRSSLVMNGRGSLKQTSRSAMAVGINPNYRYPDGTSLAKVAIAHSRGQGVPKRPPIRLDPSLMGKTEPMAFGAVVAQIVQRHIVEQRKKAMGINDPFATGGDSSLLAADLTRKRTK